MEVKNNQEQIEEVESLQRQDEVISALQKKSDEKKPDEWDRKTKAVQEAYLKYSETLAERDRDVLLKLSEDYCKGYVISELHQNRCYATDDVEEVLAKAQIGVWKYIDKHQNDTEKREAFAGVVRIIYHNKIYDRVRKVANGRKKQLTTSLTDMEGKEKDIAVEEDPLLEMIRQRRMTMATRLEHIYCEVIVNSDGSAGHLLALCYARTIPHILGEILESKTTSAKWAYKKMEGKSIGELRKESEEIITYHFNDKNLVWGQSFLDKLSEFIEIDGDRVKRGDAIYTELYDQKQIGHMSDYMFEVVFNKARDIISEQEDLKELIEEYYDKNTVIGKLVKGGETR